MKKRTLTLIFALVSFQLFAQDYDNAPRKKTEVYNSSGKHINRCPKIYSTISTGFNNSTGLIGFILDVPVEKSVSTEVGIGIGTWGYKLSVAGKYYFKPCHRGLAIGAGLTYCTGLPNYQSSLETIYGTTELVQLDLKPRANIFVAAYRYWNLGRRYNRFYTEFGWSIPVSNGDLFEQTGGNPISDRSAAVLKILSPGGLIAAIGFSFGGR